MENTVFVPILPWLIGGARIGGSYNIYCSSIGTDPKEGCIGKKIFNYRVWIEKVEEEEYLKACCYEGTNSFDNQNIDELHIQTFPLTEEGREQVTDYITKERDSFFNE